MAHWLKNLVLSALCAWTFCLVFYLLLVGWFLGGRVLFGFVCLFFVFVLWNPLPLKHMIHPSFLNVHKTCVADVNPLPFLRAREMEDWSWAVLRGKLWNAGTAVSAIAHSDKHFSCFLVSLFYEVIKAQDLWYQSEQPKDLLVLDWIHFA